MTTKKVQSKASGDFEEYLIDSLKNDPALASEYLNAAMADGDMRVFLLALGQITKASGMSKVAKATGCSELRAVSHRRNSLIRSGTLSGLGIATGDPEMRTGTWR